MTVWLILVLAGSIALCAVGWRRSRGGRKRGAIADDPNEILQRAEQQHRWAQLGDSRGVYGREGAKVMDSVSPEPQGDSPTEAAGPTAQITYTEKGLAELLATKPPCWRWVAFVSVLLQRRNAVQSRLRDSALSYGRPTGERVHSGAEMAAIVYNRMDELLALVNRVETFMSTPAFMGVFGDPADEDTADADGIVHTANRLMDYHDSFLELAERCRGLSAPGEYASLIGDLGKLMDVPLTGFRDFIDELARVVGEMSELLPYASGTFDLGTVELHMDVDDVLLDRITDAAGRVAHD
ncbi:hypothetical protein [Mycolicibacterium sp. XJ1819]